MRRERARIRSAILAAAACACHACHAPHAPAQPDPPDQGRLLATRDRGDVAAMRAQTPAAGDPYFTGKTTTDFLWTLAFEAR